MITLSIDVGSLFAGLVIGTLFASFIWGLWIS